MVVESEGSDPRFFFWAEFANEFPSFDFPAAIDQRLGFADEGLARFGKLPSASHVVLVSARLPFCELRFQFRGEDFPAHFFFSLFLTFFKLFFFPFFDFVFSFFLWRLFFGVVEQPVAVREDEFHVGAHPGHVCLWPGPRPRVDTHLG